MWPDTFGLACCAIEMMSIVSSRYDIARFGMEALPLVAAPGRPADRLRAASSHKMAAPLRQIYDQMLEPKWVIAMGACASSGGMFNNYTVLQGVDKIVPVDIHVPGCPPRPEALMEGIVRLHEKIKAGVPPAYEIRGVARSDATTAAARVRRDERRRTARRRSSSTRRGSSRPARTSATRQGFNFLVRPLAPPTTSAGARRGVAGYIGTAAGRDLNAPGSQGFAARPRAEAEALLGQLPPARARREPARVRAPGLARRRRGDRPASSRVWPTADWHEREAWDMYGHPLPRPPEPASGS